jgi:hypothetical protein
VAVTWLPTTGRRAADFDKVWQQAKGRLPAITACAAWPCSAWGKLDAALTDLSRLRAWIPLCGSLVVLADLYRVREEIDKAAPCAQQALPWRRFANVALACGDIERPRAISRRSADFFPRAIELGIDTPHVWAKLASPWSVRRYGFRQSMP